MERNEWIHETYDDFLPPPLPLRRPPSISEWEEPEIEIADVPTLVEAEMHTAELPVDKKHNRNRKAAIKRKKIEEAKKVFEDEFITSILLKEKISLYCSCKNENEDFRNIKKCFEREVVEVPLVYKYKEVEKEEEKVYFKKKLRNFREFLMVILDPSLPVYHKGEMVQLGVCEIHRNGNQRRLKIGKAASTLSEFAFDSEFETGNLNTVYMENEKEFSLFLTPDTNTKGHTQWFFFSVKNQTAPQVVNLNIMNFTKEGSLVSKGMRPFVFSTKEDEIFQTGWRRGGFDTKYYQNSIPKPKGSYFTFSFKYEFEHEFDTVYFAYSEPYTYSELNKLLESLKQKSINNRIEYKESKLCSSLGGLNVPLIKISQKRLVPTVTISARIHPGETVSSWMMEGLLNFLTSSSEEAKFIRRLCNFEIIPMLNPDGVVSGNYRTSLAGVDLNRRWGNPHKFLHPTIFHLKELVKSSSCYVDLHGHSKREHCFTYGNYFSPKDPKYWQSKLLPMVIDKLSSNFSFAYSRFLKPGNHNTAGRTVACRELGIVNSYTLEASFYGISSGPGRKEFSREDYLEVGSSLCLAIGGLFKIPTENMTYDKICCEIEIYKSRIENIKKKSFLQKLQKRKFESEKEKNFHTKSRSVQYENNILTEEDREDEVSSGSESEPSEDNLEPQELEEVYYAIIPEELPVKEEYQCSIVKNIGLNQSVSVQKPRKSYVHIKKVPSSKHPFKQASITNRSDLLYKKLPNIHKPTMPLLVKLRKRMSNK